MNNVLLGSLSGKHYSHNTLAPSTTHITQLYWLTIHKRSVLVLTTTLWVTIAPSAIQSQGRQGQPATQSYPSAALIITLGPLQRESGSPGPEIVDRKKLYGAKSLCNPILIQACILLSGCEKYSSGLSRKVCVSVNACQRAYNICTCA